MIPMIGYLRVSTDRQADSGLGLDAQRTRIQDHGDRHGWSLTWMVDDGYSAASLDRPALREALALLAARTHAGLAAAKLDRLSRSVVDFADTLATAKKQGWSVVLLDLGVDTSTPNGKLVAGLMAQIAEWEREIIAQRTREALAAARANGVRLGRPRQYPADVVALVAALVGVEGLSHRLAAAELSRRAVPTVGGGPWRHSTVRRLLTSHAIDLATAAARDASQSRSAARSRSTTRKG